MKNNFRVLFFILILITIACFIFVFYEFYKQEKPNKNTENIKVAVIDSGIDTKYLDVDVVKRFDHTKKELDSFGHGTAVANLINQNNHKVDYFDVNILDENGNTDVQTLIESLDWCIKNKVNLINMSFGLTENDTRLRNKINEVVKQNIIVVASSGNKIGFQSDYPARYNNVISISAVDFDHKLYKFASKGKIDFVAPGVNVDTIQIKKLNKIKNLSGTSFATGYASGYISKFISNDFSITHRDLVNQLKKETKFIKNNKKDSTYGYGLLIK
ncbi:S8 family serine peptidase (plasmid) [Exiguobacterium acetylicum]|uniref:S8 family serine peptidase n=1 Tax=Exiguobacterium acetylicum TaxID=41170 RepID=UPI0035A70F41